MRIKNVMTKDPKWCVPSDTAQKAASIMRDEDAGIVPVIKDAQDRTLAGVVTDRDLCLAVVAEGRDPSSVTVADCMTPKVVSCSPDDALEKATELMGDNQIRRIPVVNADRELLGIVAMADIVGRGKVKSAETHETLKEVSAPTDVPANPARSQSRPPRSRPRSNVERASRSLDWPILLRAFSAGALALRDHHFTGLDGRCA